MFGVWPIELDLIVNLTTIILGLAVLIVAIILKYRRKETYLFEVALLLFIAGFLFMTIHGKLLTLIFPIPSGSEEPGFDNNLTFNYTLTNLIIYLILPYFVLKLLKRDVSVEKIGLKIKNWRRTALYTIIGVGISIGLYLVTFFFFGYKWIPKYILDGLLLWIFLVAILSVFIQTIFYIGFLFNVYLEHGNWLLLGIISVVAIQSFIPAQLPWTLQLPWIIMNVIGSSVKVAVTYKTRNIYGAAFMGIATGLVEILIQIL